MDKLISEAKAQAKAELIQEAELLAQLIKRLKERSGVNMKPERAEALALRVSGSIEGYMAYLDKIDQEIADMESRYVPEDQVSEKFRDPSSFGWPTLAT
jgi:hypothetical protein